MENLAKIEKLTAIFSAIINEEAMQDSDLKVVIRKITFDMDKNSDVKSIIDRRSLSCRINEQGQVECS